MWQIASPRRQLGSLCILCTISGVTAVPLTNILAITTGFRMKTIMSSDIS